jgi:osmotically inducible lipoprotein OsmB
MMKGRLMRIKSLFPVLAVSLLALSACGQSPGCRAVTGAGIGAAGGAVIGALAGNPWLGAAAGAAAGAAVGGLTTSNQINAGPAPCN